MKGHHPGTAREANSVPFCARVQHVAGSMRGQQMGRAGRARLAVTDALTKVGRVRAIAATDVSGRKK